MKRIFILFTVGILTFACNKGDDMPTPVEDYLVFGHFYGECLGEGCVEIFKITNEKLFEDVEDDYPNQQNPYEGTFERLADSSYDKVADLPTYFPQELWNSTDTIFGIPDAYDQGGLYIERKTEEEYGYWLIDQDTTDIPAFLHEFHSKVNSAISRINE